MARSNFAHVRRPSQDSARRLMWPAVEPRHLGARARGRRDTTAPAAAPRRRRPAGQPAIAARAAILGRSWGRRPVDPAEPGPVLPPPDILGPRAGSSDQDPALQPGPAPGPGRRAGADSRQRGRESCAAGPRLAAVVSPVGRPSTMLYCNVSPVG